MVDDAVGAFGIADGHELLDDLGHCVGFGADGAGAGAAAERAEAAGDPLLFSGKALNEGLFERDEGVVANEHFSWLGEVERDDGNFFEMDVVPDIELGPVGEREDADAFAGADAAVEEGPQFGALVFRIPLASGVAEGEDALLGAGFFFVAARAAKGSVEAVSAKAVEEGLGFEVIRSSAGCRA